MYTDDIALIADSPATLQAALDTIHLYVHLNRVKSIVVIVISRTREIRVW